MQKCMSLGCDHAVLQARGLAAFLAAFWITAYPRGTWKLEIRWLETTAWTGPMYPVMQKGLQPTGTCPAIPTAFPAVTKEFLEHAGFSKGPLGTGEDSQTLSKQIRCCVKNWGNLGAGSLEKVTPFVIARQLLQLEEQTASKLLLVCQQCVWRVLNHLLLRCLDETHSVRLCGLTLLLMIAGWHKGFSYLELSEDKGGLPSTDCVFQCQQKSSIRAGCGRSDTEGSKTSPVSYFFMWK